jgi:hypothetical protein
MFWCRSEHTAPVAPSNEADHLDRVLRVLAAEQRVSHRAGNVDRLLIAELPFPGRPGHVVGLPGVAPVVVAGALAIAP